MKVKYTPVWNFDSDSIIVHVEEVREITYPDDARIWVIDRKFNHQGWVSPNDLDFGYDLFLDGVRYTIISIERQHE